MLGRSRTSVRLHAGPHHSLEVEQPSGRTDQHGQFVLAVDRSQSNADDMFEQAQSAEEAGHIAEAERLYRILKKSDPTDASAPFNLGNLLRALPAMSKPKRHSGPRRASTRHSRTPGTILVTCWTSKDAPTPP